MINNPCRAQTAHLPFPASPHSHPSSTRSIIGIYLTKLLRLSCPGRWCTACGTANEIGVREYRKLVCFAEFKGGITSTKGSRQPDQSQGMDTSSTPGQNQSNDKKSSVKSSDKSSTPGRGQRNDKKSSVPSNCGEDNGAASGARAPVPRVSSSGPHVEIGAERKQVIYTTPHERIAQVSGRVTSNVRCGEMMFFAGGDLTVASLKRPAYPAYMVAYTKRSLHRLLF